MLNGHLYLCMRLHRLVFMPRSLLKRAALLFIHPKMGTLSPVLSACVKVQHRSNKMQSRRRTQGSFIAY